MSRLTVTYNDGTLIDTTNDGSFTLATEGKMMADNVELLVEKGDPPTLDVSVGIDANGLITATATQTEGEDIVGTETATQQLTKRTSADLIANGASVTAPAGYYPDNSSKSVQTATQATPTISISSAGLITATSAQSAGYVSGGTTSGTKQMTAKAAATITPGVSDQTIAAGTYLTGTQTIRGDANLVSENIAEGKSIFGVSGTQPNITLTANVETGSEVTVTNGNVTLTGTSASGSFTFTIPEAGTWTVSATKDGKSTITKTVSVPETYAVTLKYISTTLNDNEWSLIRAASDAGKGANYWSVGDCKAVTLNGTVGQKTFNNNTYYVYIIGFNHFASKEGNNRIHFQFGKTAASGGKSIAFVDSQYTVNVGAQSGTRFAIFNSYTTSGSADWCNYKGSMMRNEICGTDVSNPDGTFIACLPSDLQSVLKTVTKGTRFWKTNWKDEEVIFLLSEMEVFGTSKYGGETSGYNTMQYAYYSAGNSKKKYQDDKQTTAVAWILRNSYDADDNVTTSHCCVSESGAADTWSNYGSCGFAPAFCV